MSGLLAIVNLDGAPVDVAWLQATTTSMAYCGPDAQHSWHDGYVGFGHTLLRTTFESANEQQPCTLDDKVWLVADARIDDRPRLINELRAEGCILANDIADPLLILHAYQVWGEAALDHLMGDFAFVLWDAPRHRLLCVHDQMGVAPLFYMQVGQTLIVSNTLNALRRYPGFLSSPDETAVADYLIFQVYLDEDSTIFAHIRRIPPAHTLRLTLDPPRKSRLQVDRYWHLPEEVEYLRPRKAQEVVEQFRFHFEQAVADRLRTSSAGSALSGGLDSTSIAATAQRLLQAQANPGNVRASTVVYRAITMNGEGPLAQQVADFGGFTTKFYVAEDYFSGTPDPNPARPEAEPWGLSFMGCDLSMLRETATFARIYFMGFGGDPLFTPTRLPWRTALRLGQFRSMARTVRRKWRNQHFISGQNQRVGERFQLLSPELMAKIELPERLALFESLSLHVSQQRAMSFGPLWESIFRVGDPGSTGVPVKPCFPFFDIRLLEFMLRLPPDPWCRDKFLLREAMSGVLPESVRLRPKVNLPAPPKELPFWEGKAPAWIHEFVSLPALANYVNIALLQEELAKPEGLMTLTLQRFGLSLSLANWLRHLDWKG